MKTLLEIRSSIYSDGGQSSRLADRFVAQWRAANPGGKVMVRDLAHLIGQRLRAAGRL